MCTAMLDTKFLNTSLLEVMISSKNERGFIRDLSDITLRIIFDAWWASMNVGSKRPVACNASTHALLWRLYLHCGIEESGSPGIICILCHQVLRHPSEYGTSSMGKHLLAKAHIAKLNELTESEVTELTSSMVDETALAILKRQGSRRITIVSFQRKIIFDIQFNPYWPRYEEYLTSNNVAETTPGWSDRAARLLTATRLYLNSPPEAPKNWGQINPNLNDYHSDPMEISSTFWIPDITDWWRQQEETHSKYADLSNVARDIFSIIPHGVWVEASFSLGRDVIGWRQSKTTGETLGEKVVVRQFARANNGILAGTDPELDTKNTENDLEMKKEVEERKLHRMAKVHDFLEMWQGSQNLRATQKESRAQNKQMTAVGYISDMEEIAKASWSLFPHDGAAVFKLSERSPLPPALSAKDLLGGRTQILNVRRIRRINCHPVGSDEDSAPECISDTDDWLNWNGDLDNPNDSEMIAQRTMNPI